MKLVTLLSLTAVINCLYIPVPSECAGSTWLRIAENYLPKSVQNWLTTTDSIRNSDLNAWIEEQKEVSFRAILNNIGGVSEIYNVSQVAKGAVIASPLTQKPDYFYQWTRDAALTIKSLILEINDKEFEGVDDIISTVEAYIENNYYIQRLDNKSGKFNDENKDGLGEPKFLVNNKPFDKHWGRPQRDGPGLRVITVVSYINLLDKFDKGVSNEFLKSREFIYHKIIKPDLVYITRNWMKEGFDLWEEINAHHFFTSITQLAALKDGISIAGSFDSSTEFVETLKRTFESLKKFILSDAGFTINGLPYLIETPTLLKSGKRSGLDAAIILGALHSHNLEFGDFSDIPYDISDSPLLNTLSAMVADMKYRYPINHNRIGFGNPIGVGLGRYPEDVYDGYGTSEGNPWFLATASAAEAVYRFIYKLSLTEENLVIDTENREFFEDFIDFETVETDYLVIHFGSLAFKTLTRNLFGYSDSFLEVIKDHVGDDGSMSEQFNKYHGYMQGAEELTWSHSAVWNAFRWREKTEGLLRELEF